MKPTVIDNFVSESDRVRLIEIINEKESAGLLAQTDTGDVRYDGRNMLWNTYDKEWRDLIRPYIRRVLLEYGDDRLVPHDIAMLKYYEGPGMGLHSDQDGPCDGKCELTSVIYLNDDYEGGEVVFPWLMKEYKVKSGGVMFFDQRGIEAHHAIKPVKSGNRYAIITCYTADSSMLRDQHLDFVQ